MPDSPASNRPPIDGSFTGRIVRLGLLALFAAGLVSTASGAPAEEDAIARVRVHFEPATLTVHPDLTATLDGLRIEKGQVKGFEGPFDASVIEPAHIHVVKLCPFVYHVALDSSPDAFWSVDTQDSTVHVVTRGVLGAEGGTLTPAGWMIVRPVQSPARSERGFQCEIRDVELTYAPPTGKLTLDGGGIVLGDERTWAVTRPTEWRFRVKPPADWKGHLLEIDAGVGEVGLVRDEVESADRANPLQALKLPFNVWRVSGRYGDSSPTVPTLLTPKAGAVLDNGRRDGRDHTIWEFRWSEVNGAEAYEISVGHPGGAVERVDRPYFRSDRVDSYIIDQNVEGWTWRVRAIRGGVGLEWTEPRAFSVEPLDSDGPTRPDGPWNAYRPRETGAMPTLLDPPPWAVLDNGREDRAESTRWDFRWSPVAKADEYELLVLHNGLSFYRGSVEQGVRLPSASSPRGLVAVPERTPLLRERSKKASFHFESSDFRAVGVGRVGWIWMVRAWIKGQPQRWSDWRSFDIEPLDADPRPGPVELASTLDLVPALTSPDAGAVLDNADGTTARKLHWDFAWSSVAGAEAYELELGARGSGVPSRFVKTPSNSYAYEDTAPIADEQCFDRMWRVRAIVDGVARRWSQTRSFDVRLVR